MGTIKSILIVLLSCLLTTLLVCIVINYTINSTLLDQQFIEDRLRDIDAYSLAREGLSTSIQDAVEEIGVQEDQERLSETINASLTDEWMEEQVGRTLEEVLPYLQSETETLELVISCTDVKAQIKDDLDTSVHENPPLELQGKAEPYYELYLMTSYEIIDAQIPDEVELVADDSAILQHARQLVTWLSTMLVELMIAGIIIMGLIILIIREPQNILRTLGIVTLCAGGICVALALIISRTVPSIIAGEILPDIVSEDIISRLLNPIMSPTQIAGIGLAAIGLLMLIGAYLMWRRNRVESYGR